MIHTFTSILFYQLTTQLWKIPTPSLYLWGVEVVRPSSLKVTNPSLQWGSGNATAVTSTGQCLLHLVHFCHEDQDFSHSPNLSCSIQLRFGYIWSKVVGRTRGMMHQMELFVDEHIIQVCGIGHTHNFTLFNGTHVSKISAGRLKQCSLLSVKFIYYTACLHCR